MKIAAIVSYIIMSAALLPAWQATSGKQCARRHPAAVPRNQSCACSAQLWPAQQQRQSIKRIHLNSSAQLRRQWVQRGSTFAAAAAADGGGSSSSDGAYADAVLPAGKAIPIRLSATAEQDTYSLKDTKVCGTLPPAFTAVCVTQQHIGGHMLLVQTTTAKPTTCLVDTDDDARGTFLQHLFKNFKL